MKQIKKSKLNICNFGNSGSTLITVIVIVAFMSILATVMLYLAGENYKMKATDLKTKASFYEAEEVMEIMKTQLALDVAAASKPAYTSTVVNYIQDTNKNIRAESYYKAFRNNYINIWNSHWDVGGLDTEDGMKQGIGQLFPGATNIVPNFTTKSATFDITLNGKKLKCKLENFSFSNCISVPAETAMYDSAGKVKNYHLYGSFVSDVDYQPFTLTVVNEKNFTSVISTSFEVDPPVLNWGDSIDNSASELDYTDCIHYYGWSKE